MVLDSLEHGATWLVGVSAIAETAVAREAEYLLEIPGELLGFDVECAKTFDSRGVDDIPTGGQGQHLTERGGVHTRVVGIGDLGSAEIGIGQETVDEGRFPHSTITAQHGDLTLEQLHHCFNTIASLCRDGATFISHRLVEINHHVEIAQFVVIEDVHLIKYKDNRYAICLGRGKKAIDEGCGGLGIIDRDHQHCLIDIGGNDMTLLGEIRRLTDDIVAAVGYLSDKCSALVVGHKSYMVTHSHGVGAADALEAEVALYLTIDKLATVVGLDGVPASCITNY